MSSLPIAGVFNDAYVAEQYEQFRRDQASVDESWRQFFRFAEGIAGGGAATAGPPRDAAFLRKVAGAATLLAAIREYGHFAAQLDPLGSSPPGAAELTPAFHGISEADLHDVPASVREAGIGHGAATYLQDQDFVDAVLEDRQPAISVYAAARTCLAAIAAMQSAKLGHPVKVQPVPDRSAEWPAYREDQRQNRERRLDQLRLLDALYELPL
jgi:hypothetical protein